MRIGYLYDSAQTEKLIIFNDIYFLAKFVFLCGKIVYVPQCRRY